MAVDKTPRRLGRGLDALLGQKPAITANHGDAAVAAPVAVAEMSALRELPMSEIQASRYQPRSEFADTELKELRDSIKATGLLQPITVRTVPDKAGYEIVAGERRFRAIQALGWTHIPAIVRDFNDQTTLTLALIENLQRQDLNPIEEAEGYARLSSEFGLTQNGIAELVGKDRSTVANLLRVLALPGDVRKMVQDGSLSLGHARALLAIDDTGVITRLARETVDLGLSVRVVEQRAREQAPTPTAAKRGRPMKADVRSAEIRHVEDLLRKKLQTDVSVNPKNGQKGEVRIQYYSHDDLNRLLEILDALE